MNKKQKIVTIGGGTGSFTLLSGLKKYNVDLSAVVNMADDGGSTGVLRDELGVLPPGDIRQCLVALSRSDKLLRELFNHRYYNNGSLKGHSFGNIFLSTLEKISGSFDQAIKEASQVLRISGKIIPVTLTNTKLIAEFKNGKKIIGQHNIDESSLLGFKKLLLSPRAKINNDVITSIKNADKIVINPGNLYCSIIPNFLVRGLSEAVAESRAVKIYVSNLMTKSGHTDGFTVVDYINELEKYIGEGVINTVICDKGKPSDNLIERYAKKGEHFISSGNLKSKNKINFIKSDILSNKIYKQNKSDKIKRTLIRHDSDKIAKIIYNL